MWVVSTMGTRFLVPSNKLTEFFDANHGCVVHEHIPIWSPEIKEKNGRKKK